MMASVSLAESPPCVSCADTSSASRVSRQAPAWLLALFTLGYVFFSGILQNVNPISYSAVWVLKNKAPLICMLPLVLLLVCRDLPGFRRVLGQNKVMVAFCLLSLLSCLWSVSPETSLMEAVNLAVTCACAFAAVVHLDVERQLKAFTCALLVVAAGSLLVCVALPGIGVMSVEFPGAWRGLFIHKNVLGRTMSFAAVCGIVSVLHGRNSLAGAALVALSVLLVMKSQSKTALVLVLLLLTVLPVLWLLQRQPRVFRGIAAVLLLLAGVGIGCEAAFGSLLFAITDMAEAAAHSIGKNLSITGRDFIWRICFDAISQQPMLGYGHHAFWVYPGPVGWVWQSTNWRTPHAHNGYIELMLGLGITGMILFAGMLLTAVKRALQQVSHAATWAACWPLLTVFFILLSACNESLLINPVERLWLIQLIWCGNLLTNRNHACEKHS